MKLISRLLLALLLAAPALSARAQNDDLKKKYKEFVEKAKAEQAARGAGTAAESGEKNPEAPAKLPPPVPAGLEALRSLRGRYKGADLSLDQIIANLEASERNLDVLISYVSTRPAMGDVEKAWKLLEQETVLSRASIADGDAALARGIPVDPPSRFPSLAIGYLMRARGLHRDEPAQRAALLDKAVLMENVSGLSAALIRFKRANPPEPANVANYEGWLAPEKKALDALK